MKKYFNKIVVFTICLVMPWVVMLYSVMAKPRVFTGSIMSTIRYKIDLIKDTPGNRLILVGGSSSPYGTICDEFEKQFEMPCINIGATAYLGLEYYINILDKYAHTGDVVVIAPEHILLNSKGVDYKTLWYGVENDIDAINCIPLSYYKDMGSGFKAYIKDKISVLKNDGESKKYTEIDYIPKGFGPKGDVIKYRTTLLESGYNKQDMISFEKEKIYKPNIKVLNRYYKKAKKKGITVLFCYAPVNRMAITSTRQENAEYHDTIKQMVDIPVVANLSDHILPGELFYDSNNHLTTDGAQIHTGLMIDEIKNYMANPQNY